MNLLDKNYSSLTPAERLEFAKKYKLSDLSESKVIEIRNWEAQEDNRLQIRALLAKPMNQRTNFLRVPMSNGGSIL